MSRTQRHFVAGMPAQLIQRGADRRPCFTAPSDCLMYRFIATVRSRNGCAATEDWGQTRRV